MMAVWTPGSYLIREYERHVEALTAADPARAPLAVEKTRKNRWRVTTNGARTVWVRYRVYAHEMSVRTNWVDEEFAMINGAPTFITLLESPSRRVHEVRLVLPRTWAKSFSGMTPGVAENTYVAPDYDTLVDSPIVAGSPSVYEFSVRGKPHYLVNFRERGVWNGPQAAQDLAKTAETIAAILGRRAVRSLLLLQHHWIGGERARAQELDAHEHSARRDASRARDISSGSASPATNIFTPGTSSGSGQSELGPFDYENEIYTRSLWFVEGRDRLLRRSIPRAGGCRDPRGVPRRALGADSLAANDAGQAGAVGRSGVVRCVDQVLPHG